MSEKKKFNILFVCTGNTCRSPMAEFLFKDYLKGKKRLSDFAVSSAGLCAVKGDVLSKQADEALNVLGVPHKSDRKAKVVTVQTVLDADLIVAMSAAHAERCDGAQAVSFEQLIGAPVADPYGGSLQQYLDCAVQMRSAFDKILALADKLRTQKV